MRRRSLPKRTNSRRFGSIKKFIYILIFIVLLLVGIKVLVIAKSYGPFIFQLIFNHDISLSSNNGQVNILLLGIGGASHDGPNLTDTIILASVDQSKNSLTLLSIPRDLWIPEMKGKINTAYAIGQNKQLGDGLILAKAAVERVTGQQINYGVRLDFGGFVKAVNLLGGLNIDVVRTFDDYQYPIEGKEDDTCGESQQQIQDIATASSELEAFPCRYKHIHFTSGLQHMDGETALEYVRSRHAIGIEGSDFARSAREEKVIATLKNKILSAETLLNPSKIIALYEVLKDSVDTDIPEDKFDDFIRLGQKLRGAKIHTYVIDEGDTTQNRPGLLINPTSNLQDYGFQWTLIPRVGNGNYSEIQKYTNCILISVNCTVAKTSM